MREYKKSEFYYPDGRINANVAFRFVYERMQEMSPEEFIAMRDAPMPSYPASTKADRSAKKAPTKSPKPVQSSTVPGKKASPKVAKSAPVSGRAKPKKPGI